MWETTEDEVCIIDTDVEDYWRGYKYYWQLCGRLLTMRYVLLTMMWETTEADTCINNVRDS